MLRFILKQDRTVGEFGGPVETTYETVDLDVPELREALLRGGEDGARFDMTQLVGVEILPPAPTPVQEEGDA